jgi:Zn finger protein HypA/HybF involved in hydrogenase expression
MKILLTVVIGAALLLFYIWIEKRIAQRSCRECGAKISVDDVERKCPRCGAFVEG